MIENFSIKFSFKNENKFSLFAGFQKFKFIPDFLILSTTSTVAKYFVTVDV